jgi:uncharacterized protein (TIGR03067 family)
VAKKLPARPNLDHLRRQAKTRLAQLKKGKGGARAQLADAQTLVAREAGFASWPALKRHVDELRSLEGEWHFTSLEVDGAPMPGQLLTSMRILFDGDRFRSESPEANYDGVFTIDVDATPPQIDIDFVEGPEAGNSCYGIYELKGSEMTLCLGLVGASRPKAFVTKKGSGHALERLHRASAERPANVTGGTPQPKETIAPEREDPSAFDVKMTPLLRRLEGEWIPVNLVLDGKPMPEQWLSFGSRTMAGNEMKVVFGGQTMAHAKMRIDETATPIAVDYLNLDGRQAGTVSRGIMDWVGDEVRFLIAGPGQPRPADFDVKPTNGTLSQWRRG